MAKTSDGLSSVVQQIRFVGRGSGAVKTLGGFKKSHHTVPDAVNASTTAFLGKLCAGEIAEEAEGFFQRSKEAFGYKRKDLSLDVASPLAVLTTKDFTLEWAYALDESDPAAWTLTRTLHGVTRSDFLGTEACAEVFGGLFSELVFALTKGASVEAVIDVIEGLEQESGDGDEAEVGAALRVDYPSDCGHCVVSVEGVAATVKFEGAELAMVFPRSGGPQELLEGFAAVRAAFSLTKNKALAGLLK
ncbi:hypothetical protein CMV30_10345 [Nibricoccus aquaticus]|uniref:Uncharacterized protein n=1 Tax=Nibricoccus aquaticus TaxID=2576891 RepID=A0A290QJ02_9BACT|nr:hypothetical protein [Nibricoccus aquaticus]ATC64321.1 hypothetical protein CMV30_10345 [Nibricoccus aquaticus]